MQPDPTKTKLRAIQYDYIDGTFEFTFGGLCLFLAFIGFRSSLTRFYLLGLLVLLSGVVLSILGYGNIPGLVLFYGLTSLILFVSGGLTLWAFIHHNPPSNEAAHES